MTNLKLPSALLAVIIMLGLGLQLWYWPQLPDRMATHFDAKGNPNGWMDKQTAVMLSTGLVTILPLFFVGISQIIYGLPTSLINMPYREYWLAPERRAESLRWMTGWMMWFSIAITSFMLVLNHLTFVANRELQPLPAGWFWGALVAFLLSTFIMLVVMWRRFPRPST